MKPWPMKDTWTGGSNLTRIMRVCAAASPNTFVAVDVWRLSLMRIVRCGLRILIGVSLRRLLLDSVALVLVLETVGAHAADTAPTSTFPVSITVDAGKSLGDLKPIWRFFGADEPNYAYMKNGQKLIGELGELAPKRVFFRAHNLLTSGD